MKRISFKELLVVVLVVLLSGCSKRDNNSDDPLNSHNGISFDMTQKDVEAKGFICNPSEISDANMDCNHMDMTGNAFGFPTKNYRINIGSSGKVTAIKADFSNINKLSVYFSLQSQIEIFYPKKIEDKPGDDTEFYMQDWWVAKNNARVYLYYFTGVPPILEEKLYIIFFSPQS